MKISFQLTIVFVVVALSSQNFIRTTVTRTTTTRPTPGPTEPPMSAAPCGFIADPKKPGAFIQIAPPNTRLYCPANLIFNDIGCFCDFPSGGVSSVHQAATPSPCDSSATMILKFEENLLDSSCNRIFVQDSGMKPVTYAADGRSGSALEVRKETQLAIQFFNDRYNGNNNSISIAFSFRPKDDVIDTNILFYGCQDGPEVGFIVDFWTSKGIVVKLNSNLGTGLELSGGAALFSKHQFTDVVITYNQVHLLVFVNGEEVAFGELSGGVRNAPCPLIVHDIGDGWYDLDSLKIFDRGLSIDEAINLKH